MAWQTLRGIAEELDVAEHVDLYTEKFPRFAEAWEALKWLLSRNPEPKGSALKITPDGLRYRAYVLAGDPLAGTPNIWVLYKHDEMSVAILGIQAWEIAEEVDEEDNGAED